MASSPGIEGIEAIVFSTANDQPTLSGSIQPAELRSGGFTPLRWGTHEPQPANGGTLRRLGILVIVDRCLHTVMLSALEPE